jgi:16S rRNA (adenine1518-N6/adenine1519-N6)-dimethyltransferase
MQYAKKKYGQHFLTNMNLVEQISNYILAAAAEYGGNVLEIGPGRGVLTQYLAKGNINLKVVEIDPDMVEVLTTERILTPEQIILKDVLKFDLATVFDGQPFVLAGNFPYNISSQIIIKMIESHELVPCLIGMFQKEMADRIISVEGNKVYGRLSVITQSMYTGKKLVKIAPGSFSPPPKVDSMVIRLDRNIDIDPLFTQKLFRTIVALAFGQRRKMMKNTLKSLVTDESLFDNPVFTQRPEQLSINDFKLLTQLILDQDNQTLEPNQHA